MRGPAVLLLLAMTAAAPIRRPVLPIPPMPPAHGAPDRAAPLPNRNVLAPREDANRGVTVEPEFFSFQDYNQSQGYTPGSRVDAQPTRRTPVAPGVQLNLSLP